MPFDNIDIFREKYRVTLLRHVDFVRQERNLMVKSLRFLYILKVQDAVHIRCHSNSKYEDVYHMKVNVIFENNGMFNDTFLYIIITNILCSNL